MSGFLASIVGSLFGGRADPPPEPMWHGVYRAAHAGERGWMPWVRPYADDNSVRPYDYPRVWIWRIEWEIPHDVDPNRLDPAMNVIGLLWKPWAPSTRPLDQINEHP